MSVRFEFATASRIIFGRNTIKEAIPVVVEMGTTAMLVTGKSADRVQPFREDLVQNGIRLVDFAVCEEPTVEIISEGAELGRKHQCDVVIAIGGGSVIDSGKAIAAMITNPGNLLDYLEVIGAGHPLTENPIPCVAVPTTAGTGAEVTRNAVIKSSEHSVKVSLRSPMMLPDLVIADSVLTRSVPPSVTVSTGLDALTQLIEPLVSRKANPLTDGFCREGIGRAAAALPRAYANGDDLDAREDMLLSSLLSGMALANAGLGAVHGFAGAIGGMLPIPHGVICGRLLPFVMEANVNAIPKRMFDSPILKRFDEIARIVTGDPSADAGNGVKWIQALCSNSHVPPLSRFGLDESHFGPVIEKAKRASSMKGNPIDLTDEELQDCLRRAL
jgi:alcohol dehydrogenase class IV